MSVFEAMYLIQNACILLLALLTYIKISNKK